MPMVNGNCGGPSSAGHGPCTMAHVCFHLRTSWLDNEFRISSPFQFGTTVLGNKQWKPFSMFFMHFLAKGGGGAPPQPSLFGLYLLLPHAPHIEFSKNIHRFPNHVFFRLGLLTEVEDFLFCQSRIHIFAGSQLYMAGIHSSPKNRFGHATHKAKRLRQMATSPHTCLM